MKDRIMRDRIMKDRIMRDRIMRDRIMRDRIMRDSESDDSVPPDHVAMYLVKPETCGLHFKILQDCADCSCGVWFRKSQWAGFSSVLLHLGSGSVATEELG